MTLLRNLTACAAVILLLSACADYRVHVQKKHRNWESTPMPDKPLDYRVYLIGDAGLSYEGKRAAALQLLAQELEKAPANSAVVFLGDNIYHDGLPDEGHPDRKQAEYRLKAQLDVVKKYKGKVFFVAGNHDWRIDGKKGVRRQEKYIEEYLKRDDAFLPENACSGPEVKNLTDKLGLVAINSQWFVINWDQEPDLNEDCDIRSRELFEVELKDALRDLRNKNALVIMHHPLYTHGWHGGNYNWKEHLFPMSLMEPPKWIPVPGIGSLAILLHGAISTRQEVNHPVYREFIDAIERSADEHGSIIVAAGHEHTLQLEMSKDSQIVQILSGSGAKRSPVRLAKRTPFVYGGFGLAVLDFYKDGEAWVEYIRSKEDFAQVDNPVSPEPGEPKPSPTAPADSTETPESTVGEIEAAISGEKIADGTRLTREVIYRQKIREPLPTTAEMTPDEFPEYAQGLDSVSVSVVEKGEIWDMNHLMWGKLWTDYYYMDLKMPVLDLAKYRGGFKAFARGGGFQTQTVRLKSAGEAPQTFHIRSLKKSADKLFYPLNKTFARNVLEYQFTAGNPFGAYVLPPMAEAIGIYHTKPELVYVPKQPGLNRYNEFGGGVFMFEERPDEDWSNAPHFGKSKNIVSTGKVLEERMESDDGKIDQRMMLRNRLFDMIIGDWDRHEEQWRWATQPIPGTDRTLYQPIPRDRDQAFANYGGLVFHLSRMLIPYFKATHPYDERITKKETRWLNFQARNVDRFFLNEMSWEDWRREVSHLQNRLTDQSIQQGVRWLPDTVYQTMGPKMINGIKGRRDALMRTAEIYYKFLSRRVNVVATHKDNEIIVERLNDDSTKVTIWEYKDERTKKELIYRRTFDNEVTREINIYALDGKDELRVNGKVDRSPLVRLIGGNDDDKFLDASSVSGGAKKTYFYDDKKGDNQVDMGTEARDKRTEVFEDNHFVFRSHQYNYAVPFPMLAFNPDDGLRVGGMYNIYRFGYNKQQIHRVMGEFSTATTGVQFEYAGDFQNVWERKDIYVSASMESPQYVDNYFGMGNQTEKIGGRTFYRYGRERFHLFPALRNDSEGGAFFAFGPQIEAVKIRRDSARYLSGDAVPDVRPEVFGWQYFAGGKVQFRYTNVENIFNPQRGVQFETEFGVLSNLEEARRVHARFGGSLTVYLPLDRSNNVVLASKAGGEGIAGKFDFFQAARLGGEENLRGFASERFHGRAMLFHSTELRWKFIDREKLRLPLSVGIAPAFDYGRVFWEGDNFELTDWHFSYGGTIWLAPLDVVALSANYMRSEEGQRFSFKIGFGF